ncbi:hypothetical protein M0802_007576 [Mischocyttarus mexicanus]|nr:hypothetical protein M0802_007576 [Mischocyttarus mexicanus]
MIKGRKSKGDGRLKRNRKFEEEVGEEGWRMRFEKVGGGSRRWLEKKVGGGSAISDALSRTTLPRPLTNVLERMPTLRRFIMPVNEMWTNTGHQYISDYG